MKENKAPERINASLMPHRDGWYQVVNVKGGNREFPLTEYVRADLADAAPDLLEALRELERRITDQGFPEDGHMLTTCRAAIAKAEGRG